MKFRRLGSIKKDQKGFTLLELLLALLIGGLITGGITAAVFQVVVGSARTNNHMIAVRQVQNAGYWVSRDAQMAHDVFPAQNDPDGFPLTLSWTDWDRTLNTVTYTIESGDLKRKLDRKPVVGPETSETTTVAKFIVLDPVKTKCHPTAVTFTLPDINDTFTIISGGAAADSGQITITSGSITVTASGGATYNPATGAWTTPAAGGHVYVSAHRANTVGRWTSTKANATVTMRTVTFTLPDIGDTLTISGGAAADSGQITITRGSISVTTSGGATYNPATGAWTTPAAGGHVYVSAGGADAAAKYTSTMANATVALATHNGGNTGITGSTLIFTVTATVSPSSQRQSETRVYEIVTRPGS